MLFIGWKEVSLDLDNAILRVCDGHSFTLASVVLGFIASLVGNGLVTLNLGISEGFHCYLLLSFKQLFVAYITVIQSESMHLLKGYSWLIRVPKLHYFLVITIVAQRF